MITRGHFIGEIVDSLSDIARQVETRTKLNLNDLPVFVESFFKEVLNHLFALQLQNLNAEKSNFPGLDLGDRVNGKAFQITAQRSSHKVNESLWKITDEALKDYPSVRILIIGTKQGSYTIDADQEKRVGFTEKQILDVNDLCKLTMDLPIDRLQSVFEQVRRETARVKVELEIPDEDGIYPTTMFDFVEARPVAKLTDFAEYAAFGPVADWGLTKKAAAEEFGALAQELAHLPRITREFLAIMIERRDPERQRLSGDDFRINVDRLERLVLHPEADGELRLLQAHGFVTYDEPDHHNMSGYWDLHLQGMPRDRYVLINEYLEAKGLSWRRLITEIDFTGF
jgi:hypothetical protein